MPQLDKFAFAPQIFWLTLIFFLLYLFLLQNGLSTLYKILYFRKQSLLSLSNANTNFGVEDYLIRFLSQELINNYTQACDVTEQAFKLVDTALVDIAKRDYALKAYGYPLYAMSLSVRTVAFKQGATPLIMQYSSIKII